MFIGNAGDPSDLAGPVLDQSVRREWSGPRDNSGPEKTSMTRDALQRARHRQFNEPNSRPVKM